MTMSFFSSSGGATLATSAPVYTTRRDADGATASYSLSLWMTLLALLLVWVNVVLWATVGIVYAFKVAF